MKNSTVTGTIVDVRTSLEFSKGHAEGAVNIPMDELEERLEELKSMPRPVILCCASGARSEGACKFLKNRGVDCMNAGSWIGAINFQKQMQ